MELGLLINFGAYPKTEIVRLANTNIRTSARVWSAATGVAALGGCVDTSQHSKALRAAFRNILIQCRTKGRLPGYRDNW